MGFLSQINRPDQRFDVEVLTSILAIYWSPVKGATESGLVKLKPRPVVLGFGQNGRSFWATALIRFVGIVLLGKGCFVSGSVIGVENTPLFSWTVGTTAVSDSRSRLR